MNTNTPQPTTFLTAHEAETLSEPYAEKVLRRVNEIIKDSLSQIVTPDKNIFASADRLFKHPFGRDSAISSDKLLRYDNAIARQAIELMVATQGTKHDPLTEEEPGKIFHELLFRSQNAEQQVIFDHLRATLGIGDDQKFISYTSIDATMEFIHLVADYVEVYGGDLLAMKVNRQNETITVEEAVFAAVQWLRGNIAASDVGLVGARRTNPRGSIVADLLDGSSSFMHADGKTLVNYTNEVNTINFESLGYQALREAATTLTDTVSSQKERDTWLAEADTLRQKTIDYFWMPNLGRVAMALDRDDKGTPRQLTSESILPAVALRTGIFDDRTDIIRAIFKNLYTPSMMTCVGPRTQSLRVDREYIRYHEPPWPVLIGRVIEGAIRYNEDAIAIDLIERMLTGVYATGKAKEFHLIIGKNDLGVYTEIPDKTTVTVALTNRPEAPQGWTVATVWWATHVALPLLASRQASTKVGSIGSMLDLSLNKTVRTVPYTIDQGKAWEIEAKIQSAAGVNGG